MYTEDLDYFAIDCNKRDEQIRFLLSQLSTRDDRLLAWWTNYLKPWGEFTGDRDHQLRTDIAMRQTNWLVGQQLLRIKKFCG